MAFGIDDIFSGGALSGGMSGAMAGGMIGGPYGALAGGAIGLGMGAYANEQRDQATAAQKSNLDKIIAQMKQYNASAYKQHIADLQKAMAYFGPAQSEYNRLYGTGAPAATGQGDWGGTGVK